MKNTMIIYLYQCCQILLLAVLLTACSDTGSTEGQAEYSYGESTEYEPKKGAHGGRLLEDGNIALELVIFETGVPPEFRVWVYKNNQPLNPDEVQLEINLTRLGGKIERIKFKAQGDALRGDTVIYEPHSFLVNINMSYGGSTYSWQYDNFEGRTRITTPVANALEIETAIAGSVVMQKTISVYGKTAVNNERVRRITARFDGTIKSVAASEGDKVNKGQILATVESSASLQSFDIRSPIAGVISQRDANVGEQTDGRQLFIITDTSSVWAELSVFPADLAKVNVGAPVTITDTGSGYKVKGNVSLIHPLAAPDQSVNVRLVLDNSTGELRPGRHISATITVAELPVALAVKRSGLQSFRDFTVVYAKVGDQYEVRMLDLGLQAGEWAEVLAGLEPGTRYVTKNSYVIKADIEKSGASHDH